MWRSNSYRTQTQEKTLHMNVIRWLTPKSYDYILCSHKWRSSIQSAKRRLGADCGSDHELLIAKFIKLKKVGKTTRPFRYDLNQIPYDYTASLVAQMLKHLPAMLETWVRSLGWEDPLEKEMATHSSILAWRTPWMEETGGLQSMGSQRVGHNWVTSLHMTIQWK